MNEITTLSEELKIHGAKIRQSKNRIGQEIIEIGRELTEAKAECKQGEWLPFLAQECELANTQAHKFMKVYKDMPNLQSTVNLGIEVLYFLTTLTDEQKEQSHQLPSGEEKTIYEMNQQEVNELKKQLDNEKKALKEAKQKTEQAKKSEEIALRRLEAAENKPPKVVERVVQDESKIHSLESDLNRYTEKLKKLKDENERMKKYSLANDLKIDDFKKLEKDVRQLSEERTNLEQDIEDIEEITRYIMKIEEITSKGMAPVIYSKAIRRQEGCEPLMNSLNEVIVAVKDWLRDIERYTSTHETFIDAVVFES